jgi:hypothetical protein
MGTAPGMHIQQEGITEEIKQDRQKRNQGERERKTNNKSHLMQCQTNDTALAPIYLIISRLLSMSTGGTIPDTTGALHAPGAAHGRRMRYCCQINAEER